MVEDVHWADAATRELLDHIGRRLTNTRSLVLVTYRSDELDRRHPLAPLPQTWRRSRVAELVTLSPLGETEIAEMIAAILDHDEIGPEFRDLMHARTEGNPFVLEAAATSPSSARPRTSLRVCKPQRRQARSCSARKRIAASRSGSKSEGSKPSRRRSSSRASTSRSPHFD